MKVKTRITVKHDVPELAVDQRKQDYTVRAASGCLKHKKLHQISVRPTSSAIATASCFASNKTELDNVLILDRELGYK